ncbi:enhancer of yellow 2 transcription factor [Paragonimus westermani]|uniref:Enhancer of yellow 2 transcription factor n=1 Tax=Paragonimus westermani TaxID=34504 RepID=A0A5J4NNU1_9TREM|nr:enhancer of yellow 2 transcription factor [Paragonimus westermani]
MKSFRWMAHLYRTASEPPDELFEKVVRRLQITGEMMRLTVFIPGRLSELGWCERVMGICREYIRNHSASGPCINTGAPKGSADRCEPSDLSVDAIVQEVTPQAKLWIPNELYNELTSRIVEFIGEQHLD